ncbi:aspartate/glutamate racemase family protein [Hydrogenophaga defluvii]|uniref:Aspartate/glutamate racemase family protein n=1 Tax=Hydrogenophaga defluvii TaxID=249410 RepID=A0ABW2SA60_9BURK
MPANTPQEAMAEGSTSPRPPLRLLLLNPNTSQQATALMLAVARRVAPPGVGVAACNLPDGEALITEPDSLARAALGVADHAPKLLRGGCDGLIVAGFGDPGLQPLQHAFGQAVTGLGEAGIRAAAEGGRRYAIVTVTPQLHDSLVQAAHRHAPPQLLAGVRYTRGRPQDLVNSPQALSDALLEACEAAVRLDGAESIVIGGGPLAAAADSLSARLSVRVVNPVSAAVRLACARLGASA